MKLQAHKLLADTTQVLWENLEGSFTLVFPDGEIQTNHEETLISSYFWDILRDFNHTPFSVNHHLSSILKGGTISNKSLNKLMANVLWDAYFHYIQDPMCLRELESRGIDRVILREVLAKRLYECVNNLYNDLGCRLEEYVVTLLADDFIEAVNYPEIKAVTSRMNMTEKSVDQVYEVIHKVMLKDPEDAQRNGDKYGAIASRSVLSRLARGGIVDQGQLDQTIGLRGFMTDMDSYQFPVPVNTNIVKGITKIYDSLIESRSASKALGFAQKPLQQTEWFNRRSQLNAMVVRYLVPGDCGSTTYLDWRVREQDLPTIQGKTYLNEDTGQLDHIKVTDHHLVGKTLKLRTPMGGCATPVANGVCETCFGLLSHNVFRNTNIGMACTVEINEKVSQMVLKTKHLDGSSKIEPMRLNEDEKRFLTVTASGDSYKLNPKLAGKSIKLVINPSEAVGFADIQEIQDVRDLSFTRTTSLDRIGIDYHQNGIAQRIGITVGDKRRRASLSPEMLMYIRQTGWSVDAHGNYLIDLANWNHKQIMMVVPRRSTNMSDYSKEIESLLEAKKDKDVMNYRNNEMTRGAFIQEFYDLVNSRLNVNLAVLEVMAYSYMVVNTDPLNPNYALPKPHTRYGFGVFKLSIERRSLGATMAYQEQHDTLTDPGSYIHTERLDSPMDVFITPKEVIENYHETIPNYF